MIHNVQMHRPSIAPVLILSTRMGMQSMLYILAVLISVSPLTLGQMGITEWMYSGTDGGFIEFTNIGSEAVDLSGWNFCDNSTGPAVDLSDFGIVEPGNSVILTEASAESFAAAWALTDVNIIGDCPLRLNRNDQINLFDSNHVLVDRLDYGDEDYLGSPRTKNVSCNIPALDYSKTCAQMSWKLAFVGDSFGSRMSAGGDIASPGRILGYALSDYDRDDDVDLADLAVFASCYLSSDYLTDTLCGLGPDDKGFIAADADGDYDVDLSDFAVLARCYSGEDHPAEPLCGCRAETSSATQIMLNGNAIAVNGSGVSVDGTTATITAPGSYSIRGSLTDGQIAINASTEGLVEIILEGVSISNTTSAAIHIINASFTSIVLADQTQNYLSDASQYMYADPSQNEPDGCLFSADSLAISGSGTLTVYGNYNDAIVSQDKLVIYGGTLRVISKDDGIRGKDCLLMKGGNLTLTTGGDGLKSDHLSDPNWGNVTIEDGLLNVTSAGDGIAAETNVTITGGNITIISGGGHTAALAETLSAKGIKGLAGISIDGGTLQLDCAEDAIHRNEWDIIRDGKIAIVSGADGIHADIAVNIDGGTVTITDCYEGIESDSIAITNGTINITSDEDAITAQVAVTITGGQFRIVSGGGYTTKIADGFSAKGIKGLDNVTLSGGTFVMNCADDAIHSNTAIVIQAGTLSIATADDAIHADSTVEIRGGTLTISNSYEGIEGAVVTILGGIIQITSSDDGINVAGGTDNSGGTDPWKPPFGGGPGGNSSYFLYIHGGSIVVNAAGDGLDANGSIVMTGGTVIVNGPTANDNNAVDFDGTCNVSGGFLVAVGSSQMAQALSTTSSQRSIKITYNQWKTAGTLIHIETSTGTNVLTFAPAKAYKSCVFSAPALQSGTTYKLYSGGSSTGTATNGLFQGGAYTPGTLTNTFTTSSIVTSITAP
jgi:hypothetical protein